MQALITKVKHGRLPCDVSPSQNPHWCAVEVAGKARSEVELSAAGVSALGASDASDPAVLQAAAAIVAASAPRDEFAGPSAGDANTLCCSIDFKRLEQYYGLIHPAWSASWCIEQPCSLRQYLVT